MEPADHNTRKVIIIGSGPAGYTAAIYAARAGLNPLIIEGIQPGGQLTITTDVENYPGFSEMIQGPWLMEQMSLQAKAMGTDCVHDLVTSINFAERSIGDPFNLLCDSGTKYSAETLIIATGAQARWLGLESEQRLQGGGVSACATCDGFFYRGKRVAVVGGGNTAVEEALYLTNHATHVTLIHRRDNLRAEKILQDRLFAHKSISVIWNSDVIEVLGGGEPEGVVGVQLHNRETNDTTQLSIDGLFVAIGHDPATSLFRNHLDMDKNGYLLVTPGGTATSMDGVFAAGDVTDHIYRQAITAAGMGCMAALDAERYLAMK